jgi:hypothetical protein
VFGDDIQKVDIYQERFIVARTQRHLMLGDLVSCKLSEIPWESDLTERFYFDGDKVGRGCAHRASMYNMHVYLWGKTFDAIGGPYVTLCKLQSMCLCRL